MIRYLPSEDVLYSPLVRERESTLSAVKHGVEPMYIDVPISPNDTNPSTPPPPSPISYADVSPPLKTFPSFLPRLIQKTFPPFDLSYNNNNNSTVGAGR